jgi:tetratricopeptide (TPR) repeat protein
VAEAVRAALGTGAEAGPADVRRAVRRLSLRVADGQDARRVAGQIRLLLGLESPAGVEPAAPGQDVRRAARDVLEAMASKGPTVLVLDDVHWADQDLHALLGELRDPPRPAPLLVVTLSRPMVDRPDGRAGPDIRLEALDEDGIRSMVASILGAGVPEEVLRHMVARSGGNPLFLEESARMLVESGSLRSTPGGWVVASPDALGAVPTTLRMLIAARMDGLSPEEKRALQDASVAGTATWTGLVRRMWGDDAAEPALASLVRRDLLRPEAQSAVPSDEQLTFKHVLIRDVAYESLPRAARATRHQVVGAWLREQAVAMAEPPLADLAYHSEQAWLLMRSRTGPGPGRDVTSSAVENLRRWADRTVSYQPRLAESLYQRALQVARSDPRAAGPRVVAGLLVGQAQALIELGEHRRAIADAERARALATRARDGSHRAYALLAIGRARSYLGEVGRARSLLGQALDHFRRAHDERGQARTLHRLAEANRLDDLPAEIRCYREAHRLFTSAGERREAAMVAQALAYLLTVDGGPEFRDRYDEARRLAEEEGDLHARAGLLRAWGYYASYRGEYDEALRALREARPLARQAGDRWVEVDTTLLEAQVSSVVGDPSHAAKLAEEIMAVARHVGARRLLAMGLLASVRPMVRLGRPGLAAARLRRARTILAELRVTTGMTEVELVRVSADLDRGSWSRVIRSAPAMEALAEKDQARLFFAHGPTLAGRAHLGAGRAREAVEELRRAVTVAHDTDATGLADLAEAALAQALLLSGSRPSSTKAVRSSTNPEVLGLRFENRGLADLARGHPDRADAAFESAVRAWESLGSTVWLARALRWRAQALRSLRRHRAARAAERRADEVLAAIQAPVSALA